MFLPYECARLFTSDPELIAMSIRGIRINMCVFPVIGYQMVITTFFMSIGKAKISMFLSLSRQLIFLLPLLIILPRYFESDGVWAALPASDLLSAVVTAVIMVVFMKRFKKQNKLSQSYEQ
jgi:MATE efflux family protein